MYVAFFVLYALFSTFLPAIRADDDIGTDVGNETQFTVNKNGPCYPNPCLHGGICMQIGGTNDYKCNCPTSYTGKNCQTLVSPPNPCNSYPCKNGGSCYPNSDGSYKCVCKPNWTGYQCGSPVQSNPCDSHPCLHGGTCNNWNNTAFTCCCTPEYIGKYCQTLFCVHDCNGLAPGKYPYCGNCQMYVQCSDQYGTKIKKCCDDKYYNRFSKRCVKSPNVCLD